MVTAPRCASSCAPPVVQLPDTGIVIAFAEPGCFHGSPRLNKIGKVVITQKRVAEEVGVHVSTVSLAMRNDVRLPAATKQRIQEAARRLGYQPNPLVSLLLSRVRRSNASYRGTLGFIHTVPQGTAWIKAPVYQNYLAGARRRAGELGYNVSEFFLSSELSPRRLVTMLLTRNIAGVIVEHVPSHLCPDRHLPLDLSRFAVASVAVPLASPAVNYVANDQFMRPIVAARELLRLGYRRLGLVIDESLDCGMAHRCSAGFWAVQRYGCDLPNLPICRFSYGKLPGLRRWVAKHRPEVVIGTHEFLREHITKLGLSIPGDIGWVNLDWQPSVEPSAGVDGNSEQIGAAAVELVVSQLHRGEFGPPPHAMNYFVNGTWRPGKTVRKVGPPLQFDSAFFADLHFPAAATGGAR